MKIIFIINRYKFRRLAFNNFLKIKDVNGYRLIDLSGPYFFWLGYLLYKLNLSKKFRFISCDGWPFLNNIKNSINLWFGGTLQKIPENYKNYQNNYVTASTLFTSTEKIIQFYPFNVKTRKNLEKPKITIALSCKLINDPIALKIWNEKKNIILKNLSLVEEKEFWKIPALETLDTKKKQFLYTCIKSLVRIELLKILKDKFQDRCILIGDDLKRYFPEALKSEFKHDYLKNFYDGNICLDFLAKDGEQILYPRSIEILENGGTLFQIKSKNSHNLFEKYENDLTFNSSEEMIDKLENLIKNDNLKIINNFFMKKFNSFNYNENTLKKIFL